MNNRIRELAEQAGIEFDDDFPLEPETIYYLKLSDFEKFGELIVRECLDIVEDEDDGSADTKSVRWAMIRIKKHFGVEE